MIDDENELIEAFKECLSDKYNIIGFNSAADFLVYLSDQPNRPFQIAVTDYKLGNTNGLDMIEKARLINKNIVFILLSGFIDQMTAQHAQRVGAYCILEKPVQIETLEQKIQDLILSFDIPK